MNEKHETSVKTYRFKISNSELYDEMVLFADKNRFLNKEDLKESYEKWIEEPKISCMVRGEEEMLKTNNYDLEKTNVSQKIFKSIKYYHIKKITTVPVETTRDAPKQKRKKEMTFSKELLESVKTGLNASQNLKPSQYYANFVDSNEDLIKKEKERLGCTDEHSSLFESKLKKMMKNQYYMMFQKSR